MREQLAERLLARVMAWAPDDVARERPILQAMAAYKYDEYQQFSPGMRFVESLALSLSRLKTAAEKATFYEFVKKRLIFFSTAEINHLVSVAYPDFVRPHLLRQAAEQQGLNPYHIAKVAGTNAFKIRERECLFLGLSDGARTDTFRRTSSPHIGHEQVLQSYEISTGRVSKLLEKLRGVVTQFAGEDGYAKEARFRTVVLLDDFSASGTSYLRREGDKFKGKIGDFHRDIIDTNNPMSQLVNLKDAEILLVLYIATDQARNHLNKALDELWRPLNVPFEILVVHPLDANICLRPGAGDVMEEILEAYYDKDIEDEHTRKGSTDLKFGYAQCGLPLVLSHNTPNNSIYPLWADSAKLRPLFPRISRHKEL
ncbi:MAG: hypothetical protein ABI680_02830 [Chthoniobacteraceae bacterium]